MYKCIFNIGQETQQYSYNTKRCRGDTPNIISRIQLIFFGTKYNKE